MLETINKLNQVAEAIFEVVPKKRLKKMADTIIVKPYIRAMKKLEKDASDEMKEKIYTFIDKLSPQALAALAFATITKAERKDSTKTFDALAVFSALRKLELKNVNQTAEKIATIIERNAIPLGKIVENIILIYEDVVPELTSGLFSSDDAEKSSDEETLEIAKFLKDSFALDGSVEDVADAVKKTAQQMKDF